MKVARMIIYEGSEEWVKRQVDNSVHGLKVVNDLMGVKAKITAFTLGTLPDDIELLAKEMGEEDDN